MRLLLWWYLVSPSLKKSVDVSIRSSVYCMTSINCTCFALQPLLRYCYNRCSVQMLVFSAKVVMMMMICIWRNCRDRGDMRIVDSRDWWIDDHHRGTCTSSMYLQRINSSGSSRQEGTRCEQLPEQQQQQQHQVAAAAAAYELYLVRPLLLLLLSIILSYFDLLTQSDCLLQGVLSR